MRYLVLASALFASVLLAGTALAADEWTKEDQELQLVYTVLHMIDWGQTRYIARHPDKHREMNPILGSHPTTEQVDMYCASTLAASWFIAKKLNRKNRKRFQWFITGVEANMVTLNLSIGIGFTW